MSDFPSIKVYKEKETKRNLVACSMLTTLFMLLMSVTSWMEETILHEVMISLMFIFFIVTVCYFLRMKDMYLDFELTVYDDGLSLEIVRYENQLHTVIREAEVLSTVFKKLLILGFDKRGKEISIQIPDTKKVRDFLKERGIEVK